MVGVKGTAGAAPELAVQFTERIGVNDRMVGTASRSGKDFTLQILLPFKRNRLLSKVFLKDRALICVMVYTLGKDSPCVTGSNAQTEPRTK